MLCDQAHECRCGTTPKCHKVMTPSPFIGVRLFGGLGNQLFQWACGLALAADRGQVLVVDTVSGFRSDRVFRRQFALEEFGVHPRRLPPAWSLLVRLDNRRFRRRGIQELSLSHWGPYSIVHDSEIRFHPELMDIDPNTSILLDGYWQSYRYFDSHRALIAQHATPPIPQRKEAFHLGNSAANEESLAVGVRLYEEVSHPQAALTGKNPVSRGKIQAALSKVHMHHRIDSVYVFCSHEPEWFKEVDWGAPVTVATPENGFSSAIETLWIMSKCRYHLITNSTLYWWGAWLASLSGNDLRDNSVFLGGEFFNADAVPSEWIRV